MTISDRSEMVGNGRKWSDRSEMVGKGRKRSEKVGNFRSEKVGKVGKGRKRSAPGAGGGPLKLVLLKS